MSPIAIYDAVGAMLAASHTAGTFARTVADGADDENASRDQALLHIADLRRHANRLEDALAEKPLSAPALGNAKLLGLSHPLPASQTEGMAA